MDTEGPYYFPNGGVIVKKVSHVIYNGQDLFSLDECKSKNISWYMGGILTGMIGIFGFSLLSAYVFKD